MWKLSAKFPNGLSGPEFVAARVSYEAIPFLGVDVQAVN